MANEPRVTKDVLAALVDATARIVRATKDVLAALVHPPGGGRVRATKDVLAALVDPATRIVRTTKEVRAYVFRQRYPVRATTDIRAVLVDASARNVRATGARKVILIREVRFSVDTGPDVTFDGGMVSGAFDADSGPAIEFVAPQPASFWSIYAEHEADFEGAVGGAGRFECSPGYDVEWRGRALGEVRWTIDAPHYCEWIAYGPFVAKDCVTGDGRFALVEGDADLELNYVF